MSLISLNEFKIETANMIKILYTYKQVMNTVKVHMVDLLQKCRKAEDKLCYIAATGHVKKGNSEENKFI